MADFQTPEFREFPGVPNKLVPGATAHLSPFIAKPEHQTKLGFRLFTNALRLVQIFIRM